MVIYEKQKKKQKQTNPSKYKIKRNDLQLALKHNTNQKTSQSTKN